MMDDLELDEDYDICPHGLGFDEECEDCEKDEDDFDEACIEDDAINPPQQEAKQ
jgi:hypothetical protein